MSRPLKLWNGRGCGKYSRGYVYICATTKKDAAIMLAQVAGEWDDSEIVLNRNIREIDVYFHKDCWGDTMNGITPERGLWATKTSHLNEKPERVI